MRDQGTVEQNACGSVPTVQEQVIVQGIPELQVVEQKLAQAVEASQVRLLERVQQRVDAHSKRIFERLEEFHKRLEESHKRLEISEARRAENDKLFKEIGVLWKEGKQQELGHLNGSVLEPIPEHPCSVSRETLVIFSPWWRILVGNVYAARCLASWTMLSSALTAKFYSEMFVRLVALYSMKLTATPRLFGTALLCTNF